MKRLIRSKFAKMPLQSNKLPPKNKQIKNNTLSNFLNDLKHIETYCTEKQTLLRIFTILRK